MIDTKELRRLAQAATPGPWKMVPVGDGRQKFAVADSEFLSILTVTDEGGATFGTVYDDADAKFIAAANPAAISELLDRLEAAEKERDDVARQLVQSEQGKRKISEECDALRAESDTRKALIDLLRAEIGGLQSKIAEMERQEPVAWTTKLALELGKDTLGFHIGIRNLWGDKGIPLYALPGAQPAPSVPEGWQLVPTAESRHPGIYKMLGALHAADNTPGMSEWESYRAMLSEAPEAKP